MWHRHRHFSPNDDASLHWRHNLSSPNPADPDDRLLSCLSQKSLIPASESFHFNLSGTGQKFPIGKRHVGEIHSSPLAIERLRGFTFRICVDNMLLSLDLEAIFENYDVAEKLRHEFHESIATSAQEE